MNLEDKSLDMEKFKEFLKTIPVKTFLGNTTLLTISNGYGHIFNENKEKIYFVNVKKRTNIDNLPKEFEGTKILYQKLYKSEFL